jgi:hypothetical protein
MIAQLVTPRSFVIPAKAGIQTDYLPRTIAGWIPAFAGMTEEAQR